MPYVLAVPVNQHVIATVENKVFELRADALIATLPAQAWKRISAGPGAKGPRLYQWARAKIRPLKDPAMGYWLLDPPQSGRPHRSGLLPLPRAAEHAAARTRARRRRPLGHRRIVSEREGRGRARPIPDPPLRQLVPPYHSGDARPRLPHHYPRKRGKKGAPVPVSDLIPLTVPEVRRLLGHLIWTQSPEATAIFAWSRWRRRHQARARRCHYAARGAHHKCGCSTRSRRRCVRELCGGRGLRAKRDLVS